MLDYDRCLGKKLEVEQVREIRSNNSPVLNFAKAGEPGKTRRCVGGECFGELTRKVVSSQVCLST